MVSSMKSERSFDSLGPPCAVCQSVVFVVNHKINNTRTVSVPKFSPSSIPCYAKCQYRTSPSEPHYSTLHVSTICCCSLPPYAIGQYRTSPSEPYAAQDLSPVAVMRVGDGSDVSHQPAVRALLQRVVDPLPPEKVCTRSLLGILWARHIRHIRGQNQCGAKDKKPRTQDFVRLWYLVFGLCCAAVCIQHMGSKGSGQDTPGQH